MDPQETLKRWRKAVSEGDRSEAAEFSGYLREWLARGGFEPTWHDAAEREKFLGFRLKERSGHRENPAGQKRYIVGATGPSGTMRFAGGLGYDSLAEAKEAAKKHVATLLLAHADVLDTETGKRYRVVDASAAQRAEMARRNPTGMGIVEALAWGLAAAGALYLIFRPSTASAAIVPASAARIPPTAQPRPPVTAADRAAIIGVQDRLRAVGYQPGPSTGEWNHDTNYAIANFQHDEGLIANGILDGTTAQRLAAKYARVRSATPTPPTTVAEEEGFWERLLTLYG